MAFLTIDNLNCFYGNVQSLWDINLRVEEGEVVALLGANGAGKTTLLNTITGIIKPASGSIAFMGSSILDLTTSAIVSMGVAYLPESGRLFNEMTIQENLEMGAYSKENWGRKKASLARVYDLFPKLAERRRQLARTLSGGEKQMLAMGRAIMSDPKICLFDELSYGLAPIMVNEVFRIVKMLQQEGITILLVEQNVNQSLEIASRAYVLENGRVALSGDSSSLMEDDYIKRAYLGM